MKFIKFNNLTGEILGTIICSEPSFLPEDNVSYIETEETTEINFDTMMVVNNEIVNRPARPSSNHFWIDGEWILNEEAEAERVRCIRDELLKECDWVTAKSYETQTSVPESWAAYRQALRDIPQQSNFPANVVFPEKPQ
jgi:hypothetical protein